MNKDYLTNKRFYNIWALIKQRCLNSKCPTFYRYGGRGIVICDKWLKYEGFKEDMIPNYEENLTIERIDNNGNYEPKNCRWVTMKEQQNNRRDNIIIEYQNQKHTLPEWSKLLGINYNTLKQRYLIYKWNPQDCLSRPIEKHLQKERIKL